MLDCAYAAGFRIAVLGAALNVCAFLAVLLTSRIEALEGFTLWAFLVLLPGTWVSAYFDPHFDLKGDGYSSTFFTALVFAINAILYGGIAFAWLTWRNRRARRQKAL